MSVPRLGMGLALAPVAILAALAVPACSGGAAVRQVRVSIHYSHFSPPRLDVPRGSTVRFIVTNSDPIDHEFILGNRGLQQVMEHTAERVHTGSIPGQISVPAETTRTTTFTFGEAGTLLFGCHLPGHYRYGMRGTIGVTA